MRGFGAEAEAGVEDDDSAAGAIVDVDVGDANADADTDADVDADASMDGNDEGKENDNCPYGDRHGEASLEGEGDKVDDWTEEPDVFNCW